jgi:hypothetical protein
MSPATQNMKMGPGSLSSAEKESGSENMKTGPGALGIAQNESESAKHENGTQLPWYRPKRFYERKICKQDPTPSVSSKKPPGAQNMKTGPDALGTVENDSRSSKHENGTRLPRFRRK